LKTSSRKSTGSKTRKTAGSSKAKKPAPVYTAVQQQAVSDYEEALKLFGKRDYAKAISALEAFIDRYPSEREKSDRAKMYISISKARSAPEKPLPSDPDQLYYEAVVAANSGHLEKAQDLYRKVVDKDAGSDRAYYGLAAVCSLRNDRTGAVTNLSRAIEINHTNKVYALNDVDFDPMREDEEFMALLGKAPEGGV